MDRRTLRAALCMMLLSGLSAAADPVPDAFVESAESALGRALDPAEVAAVSRDVADASAAKPEQTLRAARVIVEMAALSRDAAHPATRALAADTLRQLFVTALPAGDSGTAVRLIDDGDLMIATFQPGLGLTARDVDAVLWLEARNAELAGTTPDASPARIDALVTEFGAEPAPNQHFMSRLDGWAAGVDANWDALTPAERDAATAVTLRRDVPGPDLVAKVTGGSDIILWLGGLDIAMTAAERTAHPSVAGYFDAGAGSAGVTDILNERRAAQGGGTMTDFHSVQMLRNLNRFHWNNGVASGLDAGSTMLGLE